MKILYDNNDFLTLIPNFFYKINININIKYDIINKIILNVNFHPNPFVTPITSFDKSIHTHLYHSVV